MNIRGVDFSRANIIVGTDADAPVPTTGGSGKLAAQDVLQARVIAAAGGEATLDIGGQRVVVETHVSLNAGDKIFVRLQEQAGNNVRLSILASEPADGVAPPLKDASVDDLLRELGFPADDRTRQAARALLARDGTLDKPTLKAFLSALRPFPEVTAREARAAALLQRNGAPVTPATVALVAARAEPEAPPDVTTRLQALAPGLDQLAKAGGKQAALARELGNLLRGLPLEANADPGRVSMALKGWVDRLTPPAAKIRTKSGKEPKNPEPGTRNPEPGPKAAKQGMEPLRGVSPSQHLSARVGINKVASPPLAAPDLASQLETLAKSLGGEHQALKQRIGEAVAEVRYLQLSNGPAPQQGAGATAVAPEYLIPLVLPPQGGQPAAGRIEVYQKPRKPGEPVDANNVQLLVVLETEHLKTVQADLSIRDGVVSMSVGVGEAADMAFLAEHVGELEAAIAKLGFPTGRFGAHQARRGIPGVRQGEGLDEVVRFDRRI